MADIDELFRRRKINTALLLPFGFSGDENGYRYSTGLVDGQFEMTVTVTGSGKISAEVVEVESGEPYVLHRVAGALGAFVGRVREEYGRVLAGIAGACSEADVFKSEDARRVIQYIREKYRDGPEFLWERFPDNAIFRRRDNAKWYAALLIVHRKKLGLDGEAFVEILDLRMKPEEIPLLTDGKRYLPGYHMNKKHWITLCLDGSIPAEEIFCRTDGSFALAAKQPKTMR